jgi:succinate dehydrogenase/fumarate reductase flavoprotein subunit
VEVDVVVVGSGAGGLVAALTAHAEGLEVVLIEKSRFFGGSSALSGGGVWIPNAPALVRRGVRDAPDRVLEYLRAIAGDVVPIERLEAYIEAGPKMMEFLESQSEHLRNGFVWARGYSDYYPNKKGGSAEGRGLWSTPIDRRLLGDDIAFLRPGNKRMKLPLGSWMMPLELRDLLQLRWHRVRGRSILFKLGWRIVRARVLGERIGARGDALVTRLWLALRDRGVPIWRETPMKSLLQDGGGRVVGVKAEREGNSFEIRASRGVILATGGFDHNETMRASFHPEIQGEWSLGSVDNQGDGILAGQAVGAAVDLMDDAWWSPSIRFSDGSMFPLVPERQYPGQFIVNADGKRFVNEAAPYTEFVHAQIAGERTGVRHIPCWYVIDDRSWRRNLIAGHFPGAPLPKLWLDDGVAFTAPTLALLAQKIGVPPEALCDTAERFNRFARQGRDDDFHRGESAYERFYADNSLPNPNLAEVSRPPFYAIAFVPGDLGTKGGLVTDARARVLNVKGTPIEGLYATGNTTAAVMGHSYAGPGATIGPSMTFGYVAARTIAELSRPQAGDTTSEADRSSSATPLRS